MKNASRVGVGFLPTCMRLQDRGVSCSDMRPHCDTNYENDWHVFRGCEAAKYNNNNNMINNNMIKVQLDGSPGIKDM
jgi:hypothetical protein